MKWIKCSESMPEETVFGSNVVLVTFENPETYYGVKSKDVVNEWRYVVPVRFLCGMVITQTMGQLGIPIAWAKLPEPYDGEP